ncbi:unnamed protein product [Schistocephalus solidus]|uniref:Secreted protein n=1 Tax=Schistocephalus solidus TaxID=70667 RepID=A0A183SVF8_SCHSO|nr:unnamed protein product [Schistocephalus solidus]
MHGKNGNWLAMCVASVFCLCGEKVIGIGYATGCGYYSCCRRHDLFAPPAQGGAHLTVGSPTTSLDSARTHARRTTDQTVLLLAPDIGVAMSSSRRRRTIADTATPEK